MRTFLAFTIPPVLRQQIMAITDELRTLPGGEKIKWVKEENLHITLAFIGDTKKADIPRLKAFFRQELKAGFYIMKPRLEIFPHEDPRLVWISVELSNDAAPIMANNISGHLKQLKYPTEEKPFKPHITLARIKSPLSEEFINNFNKKSPQDIKWQINEIIFFESVLNQGEPLYKLIDLIKLAEES